MGIPAFLWPPPSPGLVRALRAQASLYILLILRPPAWLGRARRASLQRNVFSAPGAAACPGDGSREAPPALADSSIAFPATQEATNLRAGQAEPCWHAAESHRRVGRQTDRQGQAGGCADSQTGWQARPEGWDSLQAGWCHGPSMPRPGCQAYRAQPQRRYPQPAAGEGLPGPHPHRDSIFWAPVSGRPAALLGPALSAGCAPGPSSQQGVQGTHHVSAVRAGGCDLHCGSCWLEWSGLVVVRCGGSPASTGLVAPVCLTGCRAALVLRQVVARAGQDGRSG